MADDGLQVLLDLLICLHTVLSRESLNIEAVEDALHVMLESHHGSELVINQHDLEVYLFLDFLVIMIKADVHIILARATVVTDVYRTVATLEQA